MAEHIRIWEIIGLGLLGLELALFIPAFRLAFRKELHWSIPIGALVVGFGLGVLGLAFSRSYDATRSIGGMPFIWVVFQLENGNWIDYFSRDAGLRMLGNFVVGALFPTLPLYLIALLKSRENKGLGGTSPESTAADAAIRKLEDFGYRRIDPKPTDSAG